MRHIVLCLYVLVGCTIVSLSDLTGAKDVYKVYCSTLKMGQYLCPDPDYDFIDPLTQQPRACTKDNKAKVDCKVAEGIFCLETNSTTFKKDIPCKWTNGYSFETALLLSVFLGMFGVDRFYLGYPAIGLLKFSTLGFMFLGQLIDVILIATQVVGPADGSHYIIPYYGPGITIIKSDNTTFKLPQNDWYIVPYSRHTLDLNVSEQKQTYHFFKNNV